MAWKGKGNTTPGTPQESPHAASGGADDDATDAVTGWQHNRSAQKRIAIGLDPHRPTAKAAPQRPPTRRVVDGFTIVSTALMLIVVLGTLALLASLFRHDALIEGDPAAVWAAQAVSSWWPSPADQESATGILIEEFEQIGSGFGRDEQIGSWIMGPIPDEGVYRIWVWPGHLAWHVVGGHPTARAATQVRIDPEASHGYAGLVARYLDAQNFYVLAVDGEGNYRVQSQVDGAWRDVQPWTASTRLAPAGGDNTLAVEDVDGGLRFIANGSLLYELQATEIVTGATGIVAGASESGMVKVDFDWYEADSP